MWNRSDEILSYVLLLVPNPKIYFCANSIWRFYRYKCHRLPRLEYWTCQLYARPVMSQVAFYIIYLSVHHWTLRQTLSSCSKSRMRCPNNFTNSQLHFYVVFKNPLRDFHRRRRRDCKSAIATVHERDKFLWHLSHYWRGLMVRNISY